MILVDTHIWIWWVSRDTRLTAESHSLVQQHKQSGIGVSIISCWEVAKLVELAARVLGVPFLTADRKILDYPHVWTHRSDAATP